MNITNTLLLCLSFFSIYVNVVNKAIAGERHVISWEQAAELPKPEGFARSIGISGAYSAFLGDYLIIAGGANFPKGHPFFEQGKKQFYSDIFVFKLISGQLELVSSGHLPIKAGHGAAVVVDDSLYLIGGKNNEQAFNSVIKLTLDAANKPKTELITTLPFTWHSGGAAWQNNHLYLFAGKQNSQITNQLCKYSFSSETCIEKQGTPALPGLARSDFPAIDHQGNFYIFGGLNLNAGKDNYVLTDAYAFNYEQAHWQKLADITLLGSPFSVAGGGAATLNNNSIVLLGGVNREIFNNAIFQLTNLKGDALQAFKQNYFSLNETEIKHFIKKGKNYYVSNKKYKIRITINSYTFRITLMISTLRKMTILVAYMREMNAKRYVIGLLQSHAMWQQISTGVSFNFFQIF